SKLQLANSLESGQLSGSYMPFQKVGVSPPEPGATLNGPDGLARLYQIRMANHFGLRPVGNSSYLAQTFFHGYKYARSPGHHTSSKPPPPATRIRSRVICHDWKLTLCRKP